MHINAGHLGNFSYLAASNNERKRAVLEVYVPFGGPATHDENLTFVDGASELVPSLRQTASELSGIDRFPFFLLLLVDRCNYLQPFDLIGLLTSYAAKDVQAPRQ